MHWYFAAQREREKDKGRERGRVGNATAFHNWEKREDNWNSTIVVFT